MKTDLSLAAQKTPAEQAPPIAVLTASVATLRKLAQDLGIDGQGGAPPLGMQALADPDSLVNAQQGSRVAYLNRAQELDPTDTQPVAAEIQGASASYADSEASFQLYRAGYLLWQDIADYQLASSAAHQLVRRGVLEGVAKVLQRGDLPDDERQGLAMDLAEVSALIGQEIAAAQQTKAGNAVDAQATAQQLADLSAEEQLVDVMRRLATKEPVTQAEMDAAAATYQQYVSEDDGSQDSSPDARGSTR